MHPSRRDLLMTFLGLPAALAGCAGPPPGERFGGRIVGASDTVGHRLREAARLDASSIRWQQTPVVIVGGGMAGLSAAWTLQRAGFADFTLLELEPAPGGTSRYGTEAIVPHPWGAHYVPAPMKENRLLIALLEEMGVLEGTDADGEAIVAEQVLCRDPSERIFYKGRWYEGLYLHAGEQPADKEQFQRFHQEIDRWVAWRDGRGRRAFAIPVAAGSDDAEVTALDRTTMADWLDQRGFTSPRLRWLVEYGCRDDYGTTLETTSAWAGLFYFAARQRRPGIEPQPLLTWPEGNGRIVAHLTNQVRTRLQLGRLVMELRPTDTGVEVVSLDPETNTLHGWRAEQVILAAPHFLTRWLIRPWRDDPPRHIAAFEYGSWLVANLILRDRPGGRGFPLAWDNVLYESPALGYVVATHQRGLDHGPTVFTYYHPLLDNSTSAARQRLLSLGWRDAADIALTDLRRAHPELDSLVERLDVMRWGHAMVQPRPGFVWGGARAAAQQPYRGIHFAHSDLSGVGLFEEAQYHGVRAAEAVLRARGRPVRSLL